MKFRSFLWTIILVSINLLILRLDELAIFVIFIGIITPILLHFIRLTSAIGAQIKSAMTISKGIMENLKQEGISDEFMIDNIEVERINRKDEDDLSDDIKNGYA